MARKATSVPSLKDFKLPAPDTNMALVRFSYSLHIVLPMAEALNMMKALEKAESYQNTSRGGRTVSPFKDGDQMELTVLSKEDYRLYKMAHLLGVSSSKLQEQLDEEKAQREQQEQEQMAS